MMHPRDVAAIMAVFLGALLVLAYLSEETARGRRITARILVAVLGERRKTPRAEGRCCIVARAGKSDAGYYLHRVREHGEGTA